MAVSTAETAVEMAHEIDRKLDPLVVWTGEMRPDGVTELLLALHAVGLRYRRGADGLRYRRGGPSYRPTYRLRRVW